MTAAERAEVLVVGSGAGGSITAATLAEAGYDVLVLEEGPDVDTAEVRSNSPEAIARLYRDRGMTPVLGRPSIAFVEGRCVGGSTEVNSGFFHRLPPDCFDRWRTTALVDALDPDEFDATFSELEDALSVSRLAPGREPPSSAVFRRGIEALAWRYEEVPRCQRDAGASPFAPGAKQSMYRTFLPRAARAGARLRSGARVTRLEIEGDAVRGAWLAEADAAPRLVRADAVFVCAGATQTPALLRRSRIRKNVGKTLQIHPMLKAAAVFDDEIHGEDGALPVYQVKEFAPTLTLGGSAFSPGLLAMLLSENWAEVGGALRDWRRTGLFYAATRAMGLGSVRVLPGSDAPLVSYTLTAADARNLTVGLSRLGELLFAAGARAVYPGVRGLPVLRSADECRALGRQALPAGQLAVSAVHAFSSCPMGENVDFCAVDSFGAVPGLRNLRVNDASLLPDSPGANPQGPTMAIALRNARHFVEQAGRSHAVGPRAARAHATPRVLVTGAPGWLGTRLVERLAEDPEARGPGAVRCLVAPGADVAGLGALAHPPEMVLGDLRDAAAVAAFCEGARDAVVYHVAGVIHPRLRVGEFQEVNVEGTRHVLEAAAAAGARRVVVMSSNSPLGFNPTPDHVFTEESPLAPYQGYGRSKAEMEALARATHRAGGVPVTLIRSPWFYGPQQPARQSQFFSMVKEGRFPILGDGSQRRSMAYVDNICDGLMLAARRPEAAGETYWIADTRPYPMLEIVETVGEVLREFGMSVAEPKLRLPAFLGATARLVDGVIQGVGFYEQRIHVLGELGGSIACSIEKAQRELGFEPRYALREGMRESVRWCLANGQRI